jgi:TctA family transporter
MVITETFVRMRDKMLFGVLVGILDGMLIGMLVGVLVGMLIEIGFGMRPESGVFRIESSLIHEVSGRNHGFYLRFPTLAYPG